MSDLNKIKNTVATSSLASLEKSADFTNFNKATNIINVSTEIIDALGTNAVSLSTRTFKDITYQNIISDGFTPQGVTNIGSSLLISAYKNGELSRVYIYDSLTKKYEGKVILDNKAHVGGITYDKENKILFTTGSNGSVNAYNYEVINEIMSSKKDDSIDGFTININDYKKANNNIYQKIKIDCDININYKDNMDSNASTIYYYNGRIYVGSFEGTKQGDLVSYRFNYDENNNTIKKSDLKVSSLPAVTQGIAITEYNNNMYLVTAQSVGITNSSITIYESSPNNKEMKPKRLYLNERGIEGIQIRDNGEVIAVFENGKTEVLSTNIEKLNEQAKYMNDLSLGDYINTGFQGTGGIIYDIFH